MGPPPRAQDRSGATGCQKMGELLSKPSHAFAIRSHRIPPPQNRVIGKNHSEKVGLRENQTPHLCLITHYTDKVRPAARPIDVSVWIARFFPASADTPGTITYPNLQHPTLFRIPLIHRVERDRVFRVGWGLGLETPGDGVRHFSAGRPGTRSFTRESGKLTDPVG
jgi:hypothetical protein